jgi:phosphohistidine phosphatase
VSDAFADKPAVQWHRALYLAAAQNMLDMLRGAETAQSVLMLGHNPGIAQFADMLVKLAPNHPRFRDYPTGATTIIEFPAETWADVDWGTGQVVDFIVPREI